MAGFRADTSAICGARELRERIVVGVQADRGRAGDRIALGISKP